MTTGSTGRTAILVLPLLMACSEGDSRIAMPAPEPPPPAFDPQATFRYDTYGDEALWTDVLRFHEVVTTISPATALAVGLKVDGEALPDGLLETADLTDPATTVELLRLDAVVGVKATVTEDGRVTSFGITCALCHSDVDDSVAPGIGVRQDGSPASDLDPGLILSLSPYFDDNPSSGRCSDRGDRASMIRTGTSTASTIPWSSLRLTG